MANPYSVPEISVQEVARRLAAGGDFILLDVREPMELDWASLDEGFEHVPLSQLASQREAALPQAMMNKDKEVIVMCHHGNRSAQVAAWLRGQGWTNVWNMTGGIDAYAREVDPDVGLY